MDKKDEIVMRLVHFLVTKENYTPIVVNGVKNEVWLENVEGPYKSLELILIIFIIKNNIILIFIRLVMWLNR